MFVSYAHKDDDSSYGRVKKLAEGIADTYASLTGLEVGIFFDTESIRLGENWRDRIRAGLNNATVLLAFISPSYLRSPACREELASFFAFLPSREGRKLVIPILLFPQDRIDRLFPNDEQWSDIKQLQWKDASDLRSEEVGSSSWMLIVGQISQRIEEALDEQSTIDSSSTLIDTDTGFNTEDPELREGTLEEIARAEEDLPHVGTLVRTYGEKINQFNELISNATASFASATSFGQRLAVARSLAKKLEPVVDDSFRISEELREVIQGVGPGIISIIRMIGASGEAANPENRDVLDFLKTVREMAMQSLEATDTTESMMTSIEGGKGFSKDLDKVLSRMNAGLLMFYESRSHYKGWLEEVNRIYPDNQEGLQ
ncbi:toll/interleukin-1 receptor domain-containing protein [Amycolatopsis sp. NPDC026612]|uniref:toll/interleukin-1 receptor domain-containing protein n=1 Tax=Amycolatopsis sp. NPDC026612 TaxID=3155466 RepID=UPI00340CFF58